MYAKLAFPMAIACAFLKTGCTGSPCEHVHIAINPAQQDKVEIANPIPRCPPRYFSGVCG
jgi:hypothetical protein